MKPGLHNGKPLISWPGVLCILATCGVFLYLIFPDNLGFVERLLRDHKTKEALAALQQMPPGEREKNPMLCDLLEIQLQRALIKPKDVMAAIALLKRTEMTGQKYHWEPDTVREFLESLRAVPNTRAAFEQLKMRNLPESIDMEASRVLTERALAQGDPGLAAQICSDIAKRHPPTQETTARMVRLWRMTGEPQKALDSIQTLQPDPQALLTQSPDLYALKIRLLREVGNNSEAFDLLQRQFSATQDPVALKADLNVLTEVAAACGRQKKLGPVYQEYLRRAPSDIPVLKQYASTLVSAGDMERGAEVYRQLLAQQDTPEIRRKYAETSEWSGDASDAFDAYLPLAKSGDVHAIERIVALAPGLYRTPEMVSVLRSALPLAQHPEYQLALARGLVHLGEYENAQLYFDRWLHQNPDDYAVWIELGVLQKAICAYDKAAKSFSAAEHLKPGDYVACKALAEIASARGNFDEALQRFAQVALDCQDIASLDHAMRLGDSLGALTKLADFCKDRLAKNKKAGFDYLALATVYHRLGQKSDELSTLETGLKHDPANDGLRFRAAQALGDAGQFQKACAMLAQHSRFREEGKTVLLALKLFVAAGDPRAARAYVNSIRNPVLLQNIEAKHCAAAIAEQMGDLARAESMYHELYITQPDVPESRIDLARVWIKLHRDADAEALIAPLVAWHRADALPVQAELELSRGNLKRAEELEHAYAEQVKQSTSQESSALAQIFSGFGYHTAARKSVHYP